MNHPDLLNMSRDLSVDVQINRIITMNAIQRAIRLADRNDFTTANNIINSAINQLNQSTSMLANNQVSKSLLTDLQEASSKVISRTEYQSRGGKSAMTECYAENSYQRSCYTKTGKVAKVIVIINNIKL